MKIVKIEWVSRTYFEGYFEVPDDFDRHHYGVEALVADYAENARECGAHEEINTIAVESPTRGERPIVPYDWEDYQR